MEKVNLTTLVVRIENFLCIYRNYSCFCRREKYLVSFRIFVESCVVLFTWVYYLYSFDGWAREFTNNCYFFFLSANSLAALHLSWYNSSHFKDFIVNIKAVNKPNEDNAKYQRITKKLIQRFYIDGTIFLLFFTGLTVFFISAIEVTNYLRILEIILIVIIELRYYCENFIFYELIRVVIAPLELINISVGEVVEQIRCRCVKDDAELWGVRGQLEEWGAASRHLAAACDRLYGSFGVQIAFSIFNSAVFAILSLYECISSLVNQGATTAELNPNTIFLSLISFIAMQFLIIASGQRVMCNGEQLHRNLVVLHNFLVGIPGAEAGACARAAAGLARRLRAAPLRLRLLSSLAVQMALLAELLAVVANYTIVLLQFNHVV